MRRVLLVEDDELVRSLLAETLRDEGLEVVDVADADDALRHLKQPDAFNLLLTDVRMPSKLDGLDLAAHARTHCPSLDIIVMSAYAEQLCERLEMLKPPVLFLKKPFRPAQIKAAVASLLP